MYVCTIPTTKRPFIKPVKNEETGEIENKIIKIGILCYQTFEPPKPRIFPKGDSNIENYKKYSNYDAIHVHKFPQIPVGYEGKIGISQSAIGDAVANDYDIVDKINDANIDGEGNKFTRIIIQKGKK